MGPRAGLYLRDDRLTVVVTSARRGSVDCFALEPGELPAARLKSELETRQIKLRGMRIGLARPLLTVKTLELPPARGAQLTEMVAFELERHVPFPPEDMRFDFVPLPGAAKGPLRVLVVACERRTVDGALRLLEEPRLKPWALTAACHDLPALLSRRQRTRFMVWAHRAGGATDLICLNHGRLELSRTVPVKDGDELAKEVAATLHLLGWRACDAIWISGDEAPDFLAAPALAELDAPVTEPPLKPVARALIERLPEEDLGAAMLAVAVALGSRRPVLNLLPKDLRPRTFSRSSSSSPAPPPSPGSSAWPSSSARAISSTATRNGSQEPSARWTPRSRAWRPCPRSWLRRSACSRPSRRSSGATSARSPS